MVQEVYVDILLAVNFFVNLLLLSLVGGRCRCSRGRLVLAACVGALSSLHIFLPPLPVWAGTALGVLLKIGWGAAMVRIAFGWQGWYSLIKRWLLLLGCGWMPSSTAATAWSSHSADCRWRCAAFRSQQSFCLPSCFPPCCAGRATSCIGCGRFLFVPSGKAVCCRRSRGSG